MKTRYCALGGFSLFGAAFLWALGHFWFLLYSGEQVARENVFRLEGRPVSKVESSFRHDPANYQPFSVSLSPDMNDIGLYVDLERWKVGGGTSVWSVEIISADGEQTHSIPIRMRGNLGSAGGKTWQTGHVATFRVSKTADFKIQITPQEKQGLRVTDLNLSLRRNVIIPPLANLFAAVGTGIVGMFIGILSVLAGRLAAPRPRDTERSSAQDDEQTV